ncbi:ATP-dependent DNA ligase [Streptomyces huasconensis]|uniref:ATP-dependent DNA ligase n=1 Tax=Streptomyces huasconensis TaxID=1854574 RepID=UPI0037032435
MEPLPCVVELLMPPIMSRETHRSLENDGHRLLAHRTEETVRLQARSGREVTGVWMDLAVAAMRLPPGTVLDGEAVIWNDGRLDFSAVQARAASTRERADTLAAHVPATYAVWDLISHPDLGDIRARPYTERRQLLLDLFVAYRVGPPLQPVPATDDPATARVWFEALQDQGIEGIVAKRATGTYRAGRHWVKVRHSETVDAEVLGHTGPPLGRAPW